MSDFEAARRLLLSCSICGIYYGYADLVVACEQADAAALAEARTALFAERPALWAERCGRCETPLPWPTIAQHRRRWALRRTVAVPAPLCDRCRQPAPAASARSHGDTSGDRRRTAVEMYAELAALIAEVEHGGQRGGPR